MNTFKKVSIKVINKRLYVYSWKYIPMVYRKKADNKYHWTYIGPLKSEKVRAYLNTLSDEELKKVHQSIKEKKNLHR